MSGLFQSKVILKKLGLFLCLSPVFIYSQQGVSLIKTFKQITYLGPSYIPDQVFLASQGEFIRMNKSGKVLWSMELENKNGVRDCILTDSAGQEVFIQNNSHYDYHINESADIGFRVYNLSKKQKVSDLNSQLAFWPEAIRPNTGVLARQNRFSSDGKMYYTVESQIYKLPKGPNRYVAGGVVTSIATSVTGDTVAAGLRDGRIVFYRGPELDSFYALKIGSKPVDYIAIAGSYVLCYAGDTSIYLIKFNGQQPVVLSCVRSPYRTPFYLSKDRKRFCYVGEFNTIIWQYLDTPTRRDTLNYNLPALIKNWCAPTSHNSRWFLLSSDFNGSYIHHVDLDSLQEGKRLNSEKQASSEAKRQGFSALASRNLLNKKDFINYELMVNQVAESTSAQYLKNIMSSSNKEITLIADGKSAIVFHMPTGRIIKDFVFGLNISKAILSHSGKLLAFYFEGDGQQFVSGGTGDRIVTYNLIEKTGDEYALDQLFPKANNLYMDTFFFTADESHIYTGKMDVYQQYRQNAISLQLREFLKLPYFPILQKQVFFSKDSFLKTAAAAIVTATNTLEWMDFSVYNNSMHLQFYNAGDLHLNLSNLKTENYWKPIFCGERIYDFSLSNNLWRKLGIVEGEYDFYFKLYGVEILNDSLIVFSEQNKKDITKYSIYIADVKNKKIIYKWTESKNYVRNIEKSTPNSSAVLVLAGSSVAINPKNLLVFFTKKGDLNSLSLNKVIRKFKKQHVELIRYSTQFTSQFTKKILKRNVWMETRKEYLRNDIFNMHHSGIDYLCRIDANTLLFKNVERAFVYNVKTRKLVGKPVNLTNYIQSAQMGFDGFIYAGTDRGVVYRWIPGSDSIEKYAEVSPGLKKIQCTTNRLYVLCRNNKLHLISTDSAKEQAQVLGFLDEKGNPVLGIHTPDLYYHAGKQGIGSLHISGKGFQLFNAGQFDVAYNRPDKVLEALGETGPEINLYRMAREKRLRKLKAVHLDFDNIDVPKLFISAPNDWKDSTEKRTYRLSLSYSDAKYPIKSLHVLQNNVPVFGTQGMPVKVGDTAWEINVELVPGSNEIVCTATNTAGVSSWGSSLKTVYRPKDAVRRTLYVITMGVSEYADTSWNLKYAAKDAHDLASEVMNTAKGQYDSVCSWVFTDSAVNPSNLHKIRNWLLQTKRQDAVILFFAGHGLLDTGFNYYLGFPNTNFENPSEGGLAYEQFEKLLDGIPALQKAMLIDACHSGEVDKEEYSNMDPNGVVAHRVGRGAVVKANVQEANVSVSSIAADLFADLRKGTGATVLAASGGMELAMEGGGIENGLFTWCMKEGLAQNKADANRDGQIWLSELQAYLMEEVERRSGGRQIPTARIRNTLADVRLK